MLLVTIPVSSTFAMVFVALAMLVLLVCYVVGTYDVVCAVVVDWCGVVCYVYGCAVVGVVILIALLLGFGLLLLVVLTTRLVYDSCAHVDCDYAAGIYAVVCWYFI